jgi:hypothetical protein
MSKTADPKTRSHACISITTVLCDITIHADIKLCTAENLFTAEPLLLIEATERESDLSHYVSVFFRF